MTDTNYIPNAQVSINVAPEPLSPQSWPMHAPARQPNTLLKIVGAITLGGISGAIFDFRNATITEFTLTPLAIVLANLTSSVIKDINLKKLNSCLRCKKNNAVNIMTAQTSCISVIICNRVSLAVLSYLAHVTVPLLLRNIPKSSDSILSGHSLLMITWAILGPLQVALTHFSCEAKPLEQKSLLIGPPLLNYRSMTFSTP